MYKDLTTISGTNSGLDAIKNSIRNIITTSRGSLPGKPNFGCGIHKLVFSMLDPLTSSMARKYIEESLNEFEDRIVITEITLERDEAFNKLIIDVLFSYSDENITNASSTRIAINT
jgi:phage baseplate assembly protein W